MKGNLKYWGALMGLVGGLLAGPVSAQYAMMDLGVPPGDSSSVATGLNEQGQVVGVSQPDDFSTMHAWLWEKGTMTALGTLGGSLSGASGINERGQIVVYSDTGAFDSDGSPIQHAFRWADGVMIDLGTLGGKFSLGRAINERGQVVGWSYTATFATHAFLATPVGSGS